MFIENVLGTSSKVKILRTLIEVSTGFTLLELQKETGLSRGIVHKAIREFVRRGIIIKIKSLGKQKAYRISIEHQYYAQLINLFQTEKQTDRRNVVILAVWNILESLVSTITDKNSNIHSIKLFGSHARGTAAITSDIDLLILLLERNAEQEATIITKCDEHGDKIGIKINPAFMKAAKYADEFSKGTQLTDQIGRGGIDLY